MYLIDVVVAAYWVILRAGSILSITSDIRVRQRSLQRMIATASFELPPECECHPLTTGKLHQLPIFFVDLDRCGSGYLTTRLVVQDLFSKLISIVSLRGRWSVLFCMLILNGIINIFNVCCPPDCV